MAQPDWSMERTDGNAFRLTFDAVAGEPVWVLLMSDEHFDNALCDRALLHKHHREAKERNAPILKIGDTFCAMQGKWDKRADQDQLRPELRGNNYLDKLVDAGAELYSPYAEQIALVAGGNHEASINLRHQTDLVQRLAERLRLAGGKPFTSGMQGWVRIFLRTPRKALSLDLHYHHGYGGGGEVTRGMIDNSRTRSQYMADVYFSGHVHRANEDENQILFLGPQGTVCKKSQHFLRGGAYTNDEGSSWQISRGAAARAKGGWWLKLTFHNPSTNSKGGRVDWLEVDPQRAR